jgi:hypothetical protein
VQIRVFLGVLSITTQTVFGKILYNTLATVANVMFEGQKLTGERVREMLRC